MNITVINDIGTTNIKSIILIDGQEYRFILPTAIGSSRPLEFGSGEGIEMGGSEWFVGQTAIDYSPNLIWGRNEEWLMSEYYKSLHLYCIGKGISLHLEHLKRSKQGYTHWQTMHYEVNLLTAVPYANWGNRSQVALNLAGDYVIRLLENDYSFTIKINKETGKSKKGNQVVLWPRIALQGWSAYLNNPLSTEIKKDIVVIGLGGRNMVWCTLRSRGDEWVPVDGLVGSNEDGILSVVETLMDKIERAYKIQLNHQQGIQALMDREIAGYDITTMVDEVTKPYIESILSLIGKKWNERTMQSFITEIRLTGGGAILLGDKVKHKLVKIDSNDPLWAEALGMKRLI